MIKLLCIPKLISSNCFFGSTVKNPKIFTIIKDYLKNCCRLIALSHLIITPSLSQVAVASGGVCPAGYICPQGTKYPQQHPCPVGTWSNTVGAQTWSSCLPCPPGLYCNSTGLSQPSGICDIGNEVPAVPDVICVYLSLPYSTPTDNVCLLLK